MLSDLDKSVDKGQVYSLVCAAYRSVLDEFKDAGSLAAITGLANRIGQLKEYYTSVTIMDLYLNQYQSHHRKYNRDTIKSIYRAKYMNQWDFFMYLWKPYWEDFILNKILMFFYRIFTKAYWENVYMVKYYGWWLALGNTIMNIPRSIAQGIANRLKQQKEKFVPQSFVIEGFLGKIFGPIIAVGKFFMSLLTVVLVFVKLIMNFVKDPFGTLISIFTLIIGTLFSIILVIIYAILSIPGINMIVFIPYFFFTEVMKFVIFSIIYIALFALVTVMVLVLTFINIVSGGALKKFSQCQNSPGAWYRTPNYHRGNKFERSIMCAAPCPLNYRPDQSTGTMCMKLPNGMPNYCPKAEVMRIYTGFNRGDRKYTWPDYKTRGNVKYESQLPINREKTLLTHFKKGEEFFGTCVEPMSKYDPAPRAICANIDVLREKPDAYGLTQRDVRRLERVCNQSYCNARSGGAYTVCSNLTDKNGDDNIALLIKNICMIIFMIIMFVMILVLIIYVVSGKAEMDGAFT